MTGHDYLSPRRATAHFLIDELAKRGRTCVFSPAGSLLSRFKSAGAVAPAAARFNRVETIGNVSSYLWRTVVHPFNPHASVLLPVSRGGFALYRRMAPSVLGRWARDADVIFAESGIPALFLTALREANAKATIIYIVSDDLASLGCDPSLIEALGASANAVSWACVQTPELAVGLPAGMPVFRIQQGLDHGIADLADPSPYPPGVHGVSVGSMLFDPGVFHALADGLPEATLHVIGSGAPRAALPERVDWRPELPFSTIPPFIKHAAFGVAPYRPAPNAGYLAATSLKLRQFAFFGVPAICPHFAVGGGPGRFGYTPGDAASVVAAARAAIDCGRIAPVLPPAWSEVVDAFLDPVGSGAHRIR